MPSTSHRASVQRPALRRGVLLAVLACMAAAPGLAADAGTAAQVAAERARIHAERDRLEAQFAAEDQACTRRFAVTGCRDAVAERRRAALEGPRTRELALDDAERRKRADARRELADDRQRHVGDAAASLPASAASRPARPALVPARPGAAKPQDREARDAAARDSQAREAARRVAAARERQAEALAARERIAARLAERQRKGKVAAPLPVPAASSVRSR